MQDRFGDLTSYLYELFERFENAPESISDLDVARLLKLRSEIVHARRHDSSVRPELQAIVVRLTHALEVFATNRHKAEAQSADRVQIAPSPNPTSPELECQGHDEPVYVWTLDLGFELEWALFRFTSIFRSFQGLNDPLQKMRRGFRTLLRAISRSNGQLIRLLDVLRTSAEFSVKFRPFLLIHGAHPPDLSTSLSPSFSA